MKSQHRTFVSMKTKDEFTVGWKHAQYQHVSVLERFDRAKFHIVAAGEDRLQVGVVGNDVLYDQHALGVIQFAYLLGDDVEIAIRQAGIGTVGSSRVR